MKYIRATQWLSSSDYGPTSCIFLRSKAVLVNLGVFSLTTTKQTLNTLTVHSPARCQAAQASSEDLQCSQLLNTLTGAWQHVWSAQGLKHRVSGISSRSHRWWSCLHQSRWPQQVLVPHCRTCRTACTWVSGVSFSRNRHFFTALNCHSTCSWPHIPCTTCKQQPGRLVVVPCQAAVHHA